MAIVQVRIASPPCTSHTLWGTLPALLVPTIIHNRHYLGKQYFLQWAKTNFYDPDSLEQYWRNLRFKKYLHLAEILLAQVWRFGQRLLMMAEIKGILNWSPEHFFFNFSFRKFHFIWIALLYIRLHHHSRKCKY